MWWSSGRFIAHGLRRTSSAMQHASRGFSAEAARASEIDDTTVSPVETGTFRASDLSVQRTCEPMKHTPLEDLTFGTTFTDHMLVVEWTRGKGWRQPLVRPMGSLKIHPGAQVFHYGMGAFEGMKAYLGADGRGRLFRPGMNLARLQRSAARLRLPGFREEELLECIKVLLRTDRGWLPEAEGYSLYIRPVMFATTAHLGVAPPKVCYSTDYKLEDAQMRKILKYDPPKDATLVVMACPVGPYFPGGARAIDLLLDEAHVGGNYAPTILPGAAAAESHPECKMVLYTLPAPGLGPDAAEVSECGAMNMFFLLERAGVAGLELVTPPLDGTVLPGVTRDSVMQIARAWERVEVAERPLRVGELAGAAAEGRLVEMFGTGTACVVQPVQRLVRGGGGGAIEARDFDPEGGMAARLTRAITDIQYGRVPHEWSVPFE